ncbi:GNAT family N-acetyltransferase [Pseudoneobacillus sp. C159]
MIKLVPMEEQHIPELWDAAKPEEIWEFTYSKVKSFEAAEKMVRFALGDREKGLSYPFVVINRLSGNIVGSTRYLNISTAHKSAEIGWTWYNPSVWRTRVNTECKYLLLQHAFESWNLNRVQIKTDARNLRSQKAIERLGAVKEGILRKDTIIEDGYIRDTVYYSILKEEWPTVKAHLLKKLSQ